MHWVQWDRGAGCTGYSGAERVNGLILVGQRVNGLVKGDKLTKLVTQRERIILTV